jgi:hypothetical protein
MMNGLIQIETKTSPITILSVVKGYSKKESWLFEYLL